MYMYTSLHVYMCVYIHLYIIYTPIKGHSKNGKVTLFPFFLTWMFSHLNRTSESCRTDESVMSHTWVHHGTYMRASRHIQMTPWGHDHICGMTNESCRCMRPWHKSPIISGPFAKNDLQLEAAVMSATNAVMTATNESCRCMRSCHRSWFVPHYVQHE